MFKLIFFTLLFTQFALAQANEPTEVVLPAVELKVRPDFDRASDNRTTVSRKELELRQTQTLADSLRHVEGVTVVNSGGTGRPTSIFIRGSNADHVLVLIDGVEMNDVLSPSRAATLDQIFSDEIESIEILRGPQSLRYGASALNGVINIKTKKGSGAPQRHIKAELGSYKTIDGMVGLSGGEPDSNYDIRYSQFQTEGFSAASAQNGNSELDGASQSQVSGRFGARPLKNLDLDLSVRYIDTHNEIDFGDTAAEDDPDYYTDTRKLLTSLQSHSEFDNKFVELDNLVSIQRFDRISENVADLASATTRFENYHGQLLKVASTTTLNWTNQQTTQLGADFKEDRGRSLGQFSDQSSSLVGAFFSHSYTDRFGLFADFGARADRHLTSSEDYITSQSGVGFAFNENTRIRLGSGTSIKQPSLYQLYSSFGNANLKTEKGRGADLKLEHTFANGDGKLSSAVFYNHFENLIELPTTQYQNVGEARTYGTEFVARTPIASGILIGGTYTYLKSKNLSSGRPLLRRPSNSATGDLQLNFTPAFQVLYSSSFVGKRDDLTPSGGARVMDSHFVSRLVFNFKLSDESQIYSRIENLYDRRYEEVASYGTSRRAAYIGFKSQF